jgi:hypothetical protein
MTTTVSTQRRWKLGGSILAQPAAGVITIDGVQVHEGLFSVTTDGNENFLATGTFNLDDSYDSKHSISISITEGVVLAGLMFWDYGYQTNPNLVSDETAYLFNVNNTPDDVKSSIAAKGGWGARIPDLYSAYCGKNTIYPKDTNLVGLETRANLLLDGEDPHVALKSYVLTPVGSVLTFDFGIPGETSGFFKPE